MAKNRVKESKDVFKDVINNHIKNWIKEILPKKPKAKKSSK